MINTVKLDNIFFKEKEKKKKILLGWNKMESKHR